MMSDRMRGSGLGRGVGGSGLGREEGTGRRADL